MPVKRKTSKKAPAKKATKATKAPAKKALRGGSKPAKRTRKTTQGPGGSKPGSGGGGN